MIQFAQKEGATSFIYYDTGKNEEIYELMRNSKMSLIEKSKESFLSQDNNEIL